MAKKTITKERFLDVYNENQPNGWIRFAFKYFSKETENKDLKLKNTIAYVLIGLFAVGFFSTVFNAPRNIIAISTLTYSILLAVLVLYLFSANILNNIRIKKIYTELGITREKYIYFVDLYLK